MWPFKQIRELREERDMWKHHAEARLEIMGTMNQRTYAYSGGAEREIADLKDSNARLADALAAAKVRAGDTW